MDKREKRAYERQTSIKNGGRGREKWKRHIYNGVEKVGGGTTKFTLSAECYNFRYKLTSGVRGQKSWGTTLTLFCFVRDTISINKQI